MGRCCVVMNARSKLLRWLKIVAMGFAMGLLVVFVALSFVKPQRDHAPRESAGPPVTLSDEAVRNELIQVIQGQLAAFRKNDYPKAYNYAATAIRNQLPLPSFERMVRTGFPVIARSSSAEFGVILDNGRDATVNVGIVGEGGRVIHYRYFLHQELEGWKITGVARVPFEGTFV
jgi:hypothetical protein